MPLKRILHILVAIAWMAPKAALADDRVELLLLEGQEFLLQEKLDFAAKRFQQILDIDPSHAAAIDELKRVDFIRRANADYTYERAIAENITEIHGRFESGDPRRLMPLDEALSASQKRRILVAYKTLLTVKARILNSKD